MITDRACHWFSESERTCTCDLRADIGVLIEGLRCEERELDALIEKGRAGAWERGCADALSRVVVWLGRISGSGLNFATNVNDLIGCLEQSVEDERSDARPKRRRAGSRRRMTAAQGRADTYADIKGILSRLLTVSYPNQQFPPTLLAGCSSYDEINAVELLPDDLINLNR